MAISRPDFQPTQPAPMSALTGNAIDEFRVGHPAELLSLLRRLVDGQVLVQLSGPGGAAYTTVLWALDAQQRRIGFDADPRHPQLQALVDGGEVTAVAYLDAIKLQFDLPSLMLVHGHGASTLQATLPAVLYRFQRREYFRVKARAGAVARLRHPALPDQQLALRLLDVSIGGCALAVPGGVPPMVVGSRVPGVRVEFDADTHFEVTLAVQHLGSAPAGCVARMGCAFVDLGGAAERVLQRYIDLTQRRSRLLSLG